MQLHIRGTLNYKAKIPLKMCGLELSILNGNSGTKNWDYAETIVPICLSITTKIEQISKFSFRPVIVQLLKIALRTATKRLKNLKCAHFKR